MASKWTENVMKASTATTYDASLGEWDRVDKRFDFESGPGELYNCLCGSKIRHVSLILNRVNGNGAFVGGSCKKKVIDLRENLYTQRNAETLYRGFVFHKVEYDALNIEEYLANCKREFERLNVYMIEAERIQQEEYKRRATEIAAEEARRNMEEEFCGIHEAKEEERRIEHRRLKLEEERVEKRRIERAEDRRFEREEKRQEAAELKARMEAHAKKVNDIYEDWLRDLQEQDPVEYGHITDARKYFES